MNGIEYVGNRLVRVGIVHIHFHECVQREPLEGRIIATCLKTLADAEAGNIPCVDGVDCGKLREVQWLEFGCLSESVELVDVLRAWPHVVNARVIDVRFDNVTQAIEAKGAALDLLEGARQFCRDGESVIGNRTENRSLGVENRRGGIERIFYPVGKRSALVVSGASNANFRCHRKPVPELCGKRPLVKGVKAGGGVVREFGFPKIRRV